jgi:site-specific DNA-cytosine methylase
MRLGFEQAGIKTLWAIDILDGRDIHDYGKINLEKPDIISGGPPCQKTSKARRHPSHKAESLWPEMLRIIEEIRPKWIVVEQPLVDKDIIVAWTKDLQRNNYGVSGRIIDSRHWLPQQRSRWFIIGRMEIEGLALRNYLYPDGQRVKGKPGTTAGGEGIFYAGSCADCLRGGFFARPTTRSLALMGAGNAVSVPVARWIAENIIRAEKEINDLA